MFFIPYIGMSSVIYGRKILKSNYCVDVRIVFTSFKVRNYFSLKSRTLSSLLSNVLYKVQFLCDTDQVYNGKTKRHLTVRVREHCNSHSAIFDHLQLCQDNFSCNRFKILDHGRDDFETTIKGKGKGWVYSLVSSGNLSPDFTITPAGHWKWPHSYILSFTGSKFNVPQGLHFLSAPH